MAEPDTTTAPAPDYSAQVQQLYQQLMAQPQAPTGARAQVARPTSITGLLGSALGGGPSGSVPVSAEEADASGNRALLNFGLSMLANSGYSTQPRTFGQIVAQGIGGAQESMGRSEALTAARGQAQQDYAQSQQEMKMARIKEALPLLSLMDEQQRAALAAKLSGKGSGPPSIGAAGASVDVPAELMPHYAAASRETGIPVAVLIAKDKRESGFDNSMPNGGIAQILPSTAAAPGFGVKPISQAELADPGQNIRFGARYLKARGDAAGVKDWNNPDDFAKGLAAYNGGGDKNYVSNVMRYYKPGGTATTAPAPVIRPTDASGGSTASAMPARGGAQFAGPGVPTDAVEPPPSPGAAGNADAIAAGMIARGADPATLAPSGRGVTADEGTAAAAGPAAPTTPIVAAPASGLPPVGPGQQQPIPGQLPDIVVGGITFRHPGTMESYRQQERRPPPQTEPYNPNLSPDEKAAFDVRAQDLAHRRDLIPTLKAADRITAYPALDSDVAKLTVDRLTAQNAKAAAAAKAVEEWNASEDKAIQPRYEAAQKDYAAAAQAVLTHQHDIGKLAAEGDQTRQTEAAKTENSYVLDQRKAYATANEGIRSSLADYQALRMFSEAAGKSTPIDNLQIGDKTGRDILTQFGLGTDAQRDQWSAQQAFNALINKSVLAARQGVQMGQLSDRDMNFLQHMTVSQLQDPQTRSDIISYLEQSALRKQKFMGRVQQLWNGGKGLSWGDAEIKAQDEFEKPDHDIVPRVPPDWKTLPDDKKQEFLDDNHVAHGSLVRLPNNKLGRYEVPQAGSTQNRLNITVRPQP